MRIAFLVTRSDTIGGSHIHVRDLAKALGENGNDVTIFIGGSGPLLKYFKDFGLNITNIPSLKRNISPINDLKAFFHIKRELKRFGPDIISTHSSKAGFLGRLAANQLKIPVLFTAHGWSFTSGKNSTRRFLYKSLEKIVAPKTDRLITVSDYDKKLALEHLPIPPEKVMTIHNGMPDNDESFRADTGRENPVHIVMIARFDHQKDHLELLEAVHSIQNIHLHFVGDGPLISIVKEKAREYNILDQITFWGRLESVDEVLAKGQIFALISNWEGFPRSTLEAMRAGLPTVVSDVGGAAEALEHKRTGYVVTKGDIDGLRTAIKELVQDPERRKEMGNAARKRYENFYTFETMYKRTFDVYQEVLNANPKEEN